MDAVHPRAELASTRERAYVVLSITTGADILKSIFVIVDVVPMRMTKTLDTVLSPQAVIVNAGGLSVTTFHARNRSTNRAV